MKKILQLIIGFVTMLVFIPMGSADFISYCDKTIDSSYRDIYCKMESSDNLEDIYEVVAEQLGWDQDLLELVIEEGENITCYTLEDEGFDYDDYPTDIKNTCERTVSEGKSWLTKDASTRLKRWVDIIAIAERLYNKEKVLHDTKKTLKHEFEMSEQYWDGEVSLNSFDLIVDLNLIEIMLFGSKATWMNDVYAYPIEEDDEEECSDIKRADLVKRLHMFYGYPDCPVNKFVNKCSNLAPNPKRFVFPLRTLELPCQWSTLIQNRKFISDPDGECLPAAVSKLHEFHGYPEGYCPPSSFADICLDIQADLKLLATALKNQKLACQWSELIQKDRFIPEEDKLCEADDKITRKDFMSQLEYGVVDFDDYFFPEDHYSSKNATNCFVDEVLSKITIVGDKESEEKEPEDEEPEPEEPEKEREERVETEKEEECVLGDDPRADLSDSPGSSYINLKCGDGKVDTSVGEDCDDGNNISGDGCNQYCKLEQGGTGDLCQDTEAVTFVPAQGSVPQDSPEEAGPTSAQAYAQPSSSQSGCPPGTYPVKKGPPE
jgi:cysteine-rich repeat protein